MLRMIALLLGFLFLIGCENEEMASSKSGCHPDLTLLPSFFFGRPVVKIESLTEAYWCKWSELDTLGMNGEWNWSAMTVGCASADCQGEFCRYSNAEVVAYSGDTLRIYADFPTSYNTYRICTLNQDEMELLDASGGSLWLRADSSKTVVQYKEYNPLDSVHPTVDSVLWQGVP